MERNYYIDWLRIIAILLVLYFHTAMIFTEEWDWHIKNDQLSYIWLEFNFWLSQFRMPLLFFISGMGTCWALKKRTPWVYIKERHNRLMIPVIFAMFFIVPPQLYFERLFNEEIEASFLNFYPSVLDFVPYPEGNFSWHHMWFVLYLFFYSVIGLPLFLYLRKPEIKQKFNAFIISNPWSIYLILVLPTTLCYFFITSESNRTNAFIDDWGWHSYWFLFFATGYLVGVVPHFINYIAAQKRNLLGMAVFSIVLINFFRWNRMETTQETDALISLLMPLNAWMWLLAILALGKQYLNQPHPILNYANQAIYPFYILHQTAIVIIGFYVVTLVDESILAKYLFISTLSLVLSVAFYEYLIRPFGLIRFLFGVKSNVMNKKKSSVNKEYYPNENDKVAQLV